MINAFEGNGATVLELGPCYDSMSRESLEELRGLLLRHASADRPPQIVLDLSPTARIGSAFLELLVHAWRPVSQQGGKLVLCGLNPCCAEVLKVSRLDTLVTVLPDRGEAVRHCAQENSPAEPPS